MPAEMPGTTRNGIFACDQRQRLLAAAPEDERIAALQPADALSRPRQLDELQRDVALLRRRFSAALSRIFDRRARRAHDAARASSTSAS